MRRISWLDSCGMPSHIHLTVDGLDTVCGKHSEYISERKLVRVPRRSAGLSSYCRRCFQNGGKSFPWDPRCSEEAAVMERLRRAV